MDIDTSHRLAKEAGNRLRAYILSFSSASVGIFFFTLTSKDVRLLSKCERILVGGALAFFVITVVLCLIELRVDAKRFFEVAKQLEKPEAERKWDLNSSYKKCRYWLIHISYVTAAAGILTTMAYLIMRLA